MVPRQTMQFYGTKARLVVEIGFNAPNDVPCRLTLYEGPGLGDVAPRRSSSRSATSTASWATRSPPAIQDGTPQPVPLEDSLANMRVIDAVFRAAEQRHLGEALSHAPHRRPRRLARRPDRRRRPRRAWSRWISASRGPAWELLRGGSARSSPSRLPTPLGASSALRAYLAGRLDALDGLPVDAGGTPFQQEVWAALRTIPPGTTWS